MAKEMRVQLPYHKFWTKSSIAMGAQYGTNSYINCIALCLPETYLSSNFKTTVDGYTNNNTSSGSGDSVGSVDVYFTPVLLELDPTQVNQWMNAEDSSPAPDVHYVTVRGARFRIIKKLTLSFYNDAWTAWHEETGSDYTQHFTYYTNAPVVMDLTFWVRNEGTSSQYLQLVEAENITVDSVAYPNKVRAAEFIDDVWNKSYSSERTDDEAIGKLVRFISTNMQQTANDIYFDDVPVGERTTSTPPVRCDSQNYDGTLENAPLDRTTAYIYDFTGEWNISTVNPNQQVLVYFGYMTSEHSSSETQFWDSTPKYELIYNDHCVDHVDTLHYEFSNNKYLNGANEFTFDRKTVIEGDIPGINHIQYTDELLDSLTELYNMTSPLLTSQNQTPMEYYSLAHRESNITFSDQLVDSDIKTSSEEDEPTYFWVETLKNWCYYSIEQIDDACNVAMLNVWNGRNGWMKFDSIVERSKQSYVSPERVKAIAAAYASDPSTHQAEKEQLDDIVRLMTSLLLVYPFRMETLKTIAIDRLFTPISEPDYAGHKAHHWYDGIVDAFATVGSGIVTFWKGAWEVITSPVYIFYGDESMFDKLVAGWKDIGKGFLDMLVGTFEVTTGLNGGIFVQELYHYLFAASPVDKFAGLDHFKTLYAMCRYVELPYDTGYSSNDKNSYQTIREPLRYEVDGGIYSRTAIIPCICITSTIGSPFVVRSSTGQLLLAYDFSYSGPVGEAYSREDDFEKHPGILQSDTDLTNKMLQEQFGKGEDKKIEDWLNLLGNTPDMSTLQSDVVDTSSKLDGDKIEQFTALQKARGSMTLAANRSKTSSDLDGADINTVTKW